MSVNCRVVLRLCGLRLTAWLLLSSLAACRQPAERPIDAPRPNSVTVLSREQLLSGDVEKKWVLAPDAKRSPVNKAHDVRYIFYRNYNVTTFGSYGSRQGHWSFDNNNQLSFHFEGPDSVLRFDMLRLDSNALQLRSETGDELAYKPEQHVTREGNVN